MVALGAGAALAGLVTAVPQLVWLSEHKALVFGVATVMLALSGVMLWRARSLPCRQTRGLRREERWKRKRMDPDQLLQSAAAAYGMGHLKLFIDAECKGAHRSIRV